jgi:signal transduction histidine kinase
MIVFFRKLPLTVKLLLIGLVPILFLIYFSVMIYRDKAKTVELIDYYIQHVDQSQNISELINELARERRYSYLKLIKDTSFGQIPEHRMKVDSLIRILEKSNDLALKDFPKYTFLDHLKNTREGIDAKNFSADIAMQYYTDAIFRLNTLKTSVPGNTFLKPIYRDLITQKILSELITYLGIARTNIFNVLYTKKYVTETLFGTLGVYKVAKTYETEFLLKASPQSLKSFHQKEDSADYRTMINYMDTVFSTFKFDSTYTANQWWDVSSKGLIALRKQQIAVWERVDAGMKRLYQQEISTKNTVLLFLLFAIFFVIAFVAYLIMNIHHLLNELKRASAKLSKGETGLRLRNMPKGVIGKLANCIIDIDKNNLALAQAANQIGKGNFNVKVVPRSEYDLLGISIKKMKYNLIQFASQKDKIQKETEDLVYRRDEFFSIASHELKTPVTSLKAYTQLLLMDAGVNGDPQQKNMLERMDLQINKLTALINDLLDTSKIENGHLTYNREDIELQDVVSEVITAMRPMAADHELVFINDTKAKVLGDRERLGQVVNNFLTNAIKYAPDSKKIIVTLDQANGKVICSVQDFGKGIAIEEQQKIFERFYRVSGNNLNTYPGLGLGLFICKDIIEKHNGKIGVKSEKGQGSTFYFELPLS